MKIRSARFSIFTAVLIAAIHLLLQAGCARIADPQPPQIRVPKAAVDLAAQQLADSIILSVSMPSRNTDESLMATLQRIDLFRIEEKAVVDSQGAPLSEKQFLLRASRIQSISRPQFSNYLNDKVLLLKDEPPIDTGSGFSTNAFRYAVAFVNNKGQAAGLSNQVFIHPVPVPAPPAEFSGEVTESAILLKWSSPSGTGEVNPVEIQGYNVYRSEQPDAFSLKPINPLPLRRPAFEDRGFTLNKTYYYAVSTLGSLQNPYAEGPRSKPLRVDARDVFPPSPAKNLSAVFDKGMVLLLWAASESSDVAGYRVLRQEQGRTSRAFNPSGLIRSLSYRDTDVEPGKRYEYSVQAVDASGNTSVEARTQVDTE